MTVYLSDVEDKLGRALTSQADRTRALADLADAYALADAHGLLSSPETAAQGAVIRRVVVRAFRNPEGVRQESLGSRSVSYSDDSRPGVYFTPLDVADMRGVARSSVYSVRLTSPRDHV